MHKKIIFHNLTPILKNPENKWSHQSSQCPDPEGMIGLPKIELKRRRI